MSSRAATLITLLASASLAGACGGEADASGSGPATGRNGSNEGAPYAREVVSFDAGEGAGFNADRLPDIVLGPPHGLGTSSGSLDVLSLGAGGEIVLGFGDQVLIDAPGPDLIVFENPFWPSGDQSAVFAELGEVSVSEDGDVWHTFHCETQGSQNHFPGCAGVTPTLKYDAASVVPLTPELTGGDAFDLRDVGVPHARFVRIRDLGTQPASGTSSGFDLDAVGLIHAE